MFIYLSSKNYHISPVNASYSNEFIEDIYHLFGVNSLVMSGDIVYLFAKVS